MSKLSRLEDYSFEKNNSDGEISKGNVKDKNMEKVLCNHCGRTVSNGIRCLGICVADNEY
tara:strand:+ start:445 stop:624 length:180 start_codon:yes stop_codon:yes gene_type:complete